MMRQRSVSRRAFSNSSGSIFKSLVQKIPYTIELLLEAREINQRILAPNIVFRDFHSLIGHCRAQRLDLDVEGFIPIDKLAQSLGILLLLSNEKHPHRPDNQ